MPSRVLFAGLPHDVREAEVQELLTADPVRLIPSSFAISALYTSSGAFTGSMILEVANDADAERVRKQFSGQIIDGVHHLAVHHILPAHLSLPAQQVAVPTPVTLPAFPTSSRISAPAKVPPKQPRGAPVPPAKQPAKPQQQAKQGNNQPEGLKLLARLNKGGKGDQAALLEKQRAALRKSQAGSALLSRLAKAPKQTAAGAAGKKARQVSGVDKVSRAKRDDAMDVDGSRSGGRGRRGGGGGGGAAGGAGAGAGAGGKAEEKAKPKTAEELDAEMKMYERGRRFA